MNSGGILRHLFRAKSPYRLNKRLRRFFFWQLLRKHNNAPLNFRLPDGAIMSVQKGEAGATGFYYYGYPDYDEMMFLRRIIKDDDLFVDVGANSGGWSLTAFGLGGRSIAIEPIASSFERLKRNFQLNGDDHLKAIQMGVSDSEGELFFTNDSDTGNKITSELSAATEKVKVTTLDSLLAKESPVVIKIDVEGHELSVLRGASNVLANKSLSALIIETFRWANYGTSNMTAIEELLAANDFRPIGYDPGVNKIHDLKPSEGGQNTIYIRGALRNHLMK